MPSPTPVNRRTLLRILGRSIATPLLAPPIAFAQAVWPARAVRYVNGFPAGGATDTLSGIVSVTGTAFEQQIVLRSDGDVTGLSASAADSAALSRMGGIEVRVFGRGGKPFPHAPSLSR